MSAILCKNCDDPIEELNLVGMPPGVVAWFHVHLRTPLKNCLLDSWIRKHPDDPRALAEIIEHVFSVAEPPDEGMSHVKQSSKS